MSSSNQSLKIPLTPRLVSSHVSVSGNVNSAANVRPNTVSHKSEVSIVVGASKTYKGDYVAYPKSAPQVFPTGGSMMSDDFTVTEIRLHEAPNQHGTTITIGD